MCGEQQLDDRLQAAIEQRAERGRVVRARPWVPLEVAQSLVDAPQRAVRRQTRVTTAEARKAARKRQRAARKANR